MRNFKYKILTKIKDEIKDPSGETAQKIAVRLNISSDILIRTGKFYEVSLYACDKNDADKKIEILSKEILTNPLVETYEITDFTELKDESCNN